jgi:hypothetical protein
LPLFVIVLPRTVSAPGTELAPQQLARPPESTYTPYCFALLIVLPVIEIARPYALSIWIASAFVVSIVSALTVASAALAYTAWLPTFVIVVLSTYSDVLQPWIAVPLAFAIAPLRTTSPKAFAPTD